MIRCLSCGERWASPHGLPLSVYEQQAQESCPCPFCAAYTLCCAEAEESVREPASAR